MIQNLHIVIICFANFTSYFTLAKKLWLAEVWTWITYGVMGYEENIS